MTKQGRIEHLSIMRVAIRTYLEIKTIEEDWHAVSDAANDLRDIDSELEGLKLIE